MSYRHMRAFTLAAENTAALDALLLPQQAVILQTLIHLTTKPGLSLPSLDDNGLTKEDYEEFYALLPPHTPRSDLPRTPEGRLFCLHLDLCYNSNSHGMDRVLRAMNRRIKERKQAAVRAARPPVINLSRIADMLITLGLATLEKEGASAGEVGVEGRARSDVKESGHQLSHAARRKGTTV